jgi:hypothetical protein
MLYSEIVFHYGGYCKANTFIHVVHMFIKQLGLD